MSTAREDVLARIARAHRSAPPPDLPYETISRDYRSAEADRGDHGLVVERLVDRLSDYKALVRRSSAADLSATVAAALEERGVGRLVRPAGLDSDWLSSASQVEVLTDSRETPLSVAELDGVDGVITGCTLAVAETGTLILDGSEDQGRRAITLVPDYHLCVVLPDAVCADVPQALARLDGTRPITMISGPSATSDIELDRVEGVHGPRTLEVIIID